MDSTATSCSTASPADCAPAHCRRSCALEVIDELLASPGAVSGEESDLLLDLRWRLRRRDDAETALRLFCDLRLRMEQRHYLAFFRIRRWLENHLLASIRSCPLAEAQFVGVKLNHYCVEAIRRVSLCAALEKGAVLLAPRLRFTFRPVEVATISSAFANVPAVTATAL